MPSGVPSPQPSARSTVISWGWHGPTSGAVREALFERTATRARSAAACSHRADPTFSRVRVQMARRCCAPFSGASRLTLPTSATRERFSAARPQPTRNSLAACRCVSATWRRSDCPLTTSPISRLRPDASSRRGATCDRSRDVGASRVRQDVRPFSPSHAPSATRLVAPANARPFTRPAPPRSRPHTILSDRVRSSSPTFACKTTHPLYRTSRMLPVPRRNSSAASRRRPRTISPPPTGSSSWPPMACGT